MNRALLTFAVFALALSAHGIPITFVAHAATPVAAPSVTLVLQQVSSLGKADPSTRARTLELPLDGSRASIDLPPGYWSVDVETADVWLERQYVTVKDATVVTVEPRPAATVHGRLTTDDGKLPAVVAMRFTSDLPETPSGETECALERDAFRCKVPAGDFTLLFRARGYVARAFPRTPKLAGVLDAGTIALKRGQTLFGRVELGRGLSHDVQEATITARPRNAPGSAAITATPGRNGKFQIDGIAPGEYVLSAGIRKNLVSAELPVTVLAGADAELARPLVIDRLHRLTVTTAPPLAPDGTRWHIAVARQRDDRQLEDVTGGAADPTGTWSASLPPALYELRIEAGDALWFRDDVAIADGDETLPVAIQARTLRGRVLLGERPVEGTIELSALRGSVGAETDHEGRFEMLLPVLEKTSWNVHIAGDAPPLERRIPDVSLPAEGELTIRLPDRTVQGVVVDESGKEVESAMVNLAGGDDTELIQVYSDDAGRFVARGLASGNYRVDADAGEAQSEAVALTIGDEAEAPELRLVVHPARKVRGRVVSAFGPVPGADVSIHAMNGTGSYITSRTTNARGEFLFILPPNADDLNVRVAPPGFAYTIGHTRWQARNLVIVSVDQRGGTIVVPRQPGLILRHEGGFEWLDSLRSKWRVTERDDESLAIPSMEPGAYSLCDDARCVDGFLPPHGTLALSLE